MMEDSIKISLEEFAQDYMGDDPHRMLVCHLNPYEAQALNELQGGQHEDPSTGLPQYEMLGKFFDDPNVRQKALEFLAPIFSNSSSPEIESMYTLGNHGRGAPPTEGEKNPVAQEFEAHGKGGDEDLAHIPVNVMQTLGEIKGYMSINPDGLFEFPAGMGLPRYGSLTAQQQTYSGSAESNAAFIARQQEEARKQAYMKALNDAHEQENRFRGYYQQAQDESRQVESHKKQSYNNLLDVLGGIGGVLGSGFGEFGKLAGQLAGNVASTIALKRPLGDAFMPAMQNSLLAPMWKQHEQSPSLQHMQAPIRINDNTMMHPTGGRHSPLEWLTAPSSHEKGKGRGIASQVGSFLHDVAPLAEPLMQLLGEREERKQRKREERREQERYEQARKDAGWDRTWTPPKAQKMKLNPEWEALTEPGATANSPHHKWILAAKGGHITPQINSDVQRGVSKLVEGPGKGQEDKIFTHIPHGSYVLDATTVANLGDGSSTAGSQVLDEYFHKQKKKSGGRIGEAQPQGMVPVYLSDKEYVVKPEDVDHMGGGSNDEGAYVLKGLVKELRKHKNSNGDRLPPRAKSIASYIRMSGRNK